MLHHSISGYVDVVSQVLNHLDGIDFTNPRNDRALSRQVRLSSAISELQRREAREGSFDEPWYS